LEFNRQLLRFLRHPLWKRLSAYLEGRQVQLVDQLGQVGLTADDRAMLHGKLAVLQELRLHLPPRLVEDALTAAQTPPLEDDDPESSLLMARTHLPEPL